jgi:hypothetical protein
LTQRAVLVGGEIEDHALVFSVFAADFFVEALAGFVAQPAALEHLFQNARKAAWRYALGEVGGDVGEDVDAHHVGQAEGAGARPAERLAR